MNNSTFKTGLIAEDASDIDALKEIIRSIVGRDNIGFKHFIGRGCGKIRRKSDDWAKLLKQRGCNTLILVHDLDSKNVSDLYTLLDANLKPYVIKDTFVCIPVQEMEAWFLSDANAIKMALNLNKLPKIFHHPETINSPKEVLEKEVEKASNNTKTYINTTHNALIAKYLDVQNVRIKCPSFEIFYQFVVNKIK